MRIIFLLLHLISCSKSFSNFKPVENFNVNKYLGQWYEIARTDNRFEKNCKNVTANYSLRDDGGINVVNTCIINNKIKTANGRAYFINTQNVGSLKVTFFWPFYGQYNIVYLDKDYKYAIIDGGSEDYLWILSRYKNIDNKTLSLLVDKIKQGGFDINNLLYTKHD